MSRQSHSNSGTSDWLLGALKQNPEGLLLLAAGAVLLMRKSGTGSSLMRSAASAGNDFAQTAGGATSQAKNYAADIAERTKDKAGAWASSASEMAGDARRAVGEQSDRLLQQASGVQETMNRVLQEQPLFLALAGLAAGAALAAALPSTDFEREKLGPIGEQVTGAAGRVGEQLKEATAKAGETLKSAVEGRRLNADGLKEVAADVADAFTGSMSGSADQKNSTSAQSSGSSSRSD
jgi:hypothetical protein